MSWQTMANELVGQTPVDPMFALTLVNRAWKEVQRSYLWSFLWSDVAIPTPVPTNGGTVTLTRGLNTVVGDATARAAWAGIGIVNPITTQQFRISTGTFYNIIQYQDNVPTGFATITLDRLYVDPAAGALQTYNIQQVYFNAPFKSFIWWDTFKDPITGYNLATTMTRGEVDDRDPMRETIDIPAAVIPYRINQQAGNFNGFPMYEMWPGPQNGLTYVGEAYLAETGFVLPTDTVRAPLDEDIVIEQAKIQAYEWAELNKNKLMPIQRTGDFKFAIGKAEKKYEKLLNTYILRDEGFSHRHKIAYAEMKRRSDIPWVSQATNQAHFPD